MASIPFRFDSRRAALASVVQIAIVVIAVAVSRLDLPVRANITIVMSLTVVNAGIVALLLLGVRRDGPMVWVFAAIIAFFAINCLFWPAWDIYEHMRP